MTYDMKNENERLKNILDEMKSKDNYVEKEFKVDPVLRKDVNHNKNDSSTPNGNKFNRSNLNVDKESKDKSNPKDKSK